MHLLLFLLVSNHYQKFNLKVISRWSLCNEACDFDEESLCQWYSEVG
jgi:hypothetical protein